MARQSCAVVPRWLPRLGSVTARQSSSERQPNYVALNRALHLCSAGRPSRWALAHISSFMSDACYTCRIAIKELEMTSGRAPVEIPGVTASSHQFVSDVFYERGDSCTPTPAQRKSASTKRPTSRQPGLLLCFNTHFFRIQIPFLEKFLSLTDALFSPLNG